MHIASIIYILSQFGEAHIDPSVVCWLQVFYLLREEEAYTLQIAVVNSLNKQVLLSINIDTKYRDLCL